jgi:ABC-type sugar transport system ATPase subunit
VIEVRELLVQRKAFCLEIPAFEVRDGELHVLLGPTGSGKTLLLEFIAGLLPKDSGSIFIDGRDATRLPPEGRNVSYVAQDLALFPNMTVEENIRFSLRFRNALDPKVLDELVETTGVGPLLHRYPVGLSGGERQRVAIVRALVAQPKILLLDEPFSALHPSLKLSLLQLLKRLHRERELSILLVSHDVEEALALGDVISCIDRGLLQQTSRQKEVYYHPRTLQVACFFGIRNVFPAQVSAVDRDRLVLRHEHLGPIEVAQSHRVRNLRAGDHVFWGIHSEEIAVIRAEREERIRPNLFSGHVTNQVDVGRFRVAEVQLELPGRASAPMIELNLPEHAARRLGIELGRAIEIQMKPDRLFVIADPSAEANDDATRTPPVRAEDGSVCSGMEGAQRWGDR